MIDFKSPIEREAFYTGFTDAREGNPPPEVKNIKDKDIKDHYQYGYELGMPENGLFLHQKGKENNND